LQNPNPSIPRRPLPAKGKPRSTAGKPPRPVRRLQPHPGISVRAPLLHSVMQQWDAGSAPRARMGNFVLPQLPVGQALAAARNSRAVLTRRSLLCEIRYFQEKIPARRSFVRPPCWFYY